MTDARFHIERPIPSRQVSTCYVVRVADDIVVIDTGGPGHAAHVVEGINAVRVALPAQSRAVGGSVRAILVTHPHPDHVGSLADVVAATGAPVMASAHDATLIADGRGGPKPTCKPDWFSRFLYRRIIERSAPTFPAATVTRTLVDGDTLPFCGGIDVVALPGHAMGQVGYLVRAHGAFFVGDALLNMIYPRRMHWHEDADAETASLRRIAACKWDVLYVGHGATVSRRAFERAFRRDL